MWPFREKTRQPWVEEALQRTHIHALELERRIGALESVLNQIGETLGTAKQLEARVSRLELGLRQLDKVQADDAQRLLARIEHVQGLAVGGRGGRPRNEEREADRQALDLGRRILQAVATPEGRAQLILELQQQGTAAPGGSDAVGTPKWTPPNGSGGSPV